MTRCVPRYWTNKDLGKLREAKKVELNDWNKEVLAKVSEGMEDVFSKGRTQDGLTCITIDKVFKVLCNTTAFECVCRFNPEAHCRD